MFKPILLLSIVASLSACETINQASQCDPEKNYIRANKEAMDGYKSSFASGEIKSFYFEEASPRPCYSDLCVRYDNKKLDFIEKNFDDNERKGIYTIHYSNNFNNTNCMLRNPASINSTKKSCYILEKNEDNKIKSKFKYVYDRTHSGQTIISFIDIEHNIELYQSSYQTYSTGAIGGPGISTCKPSKSVDYDFNVLSFPSQN